MKPFTYVRAGDAASAVATVSAVPDAQFLAGGTNLVDLMKLGVATPSVLVDVHGLALDVIEDRPAGGLRIGAGVRNSELAAHPGVRRRFPMLAAAVLAGASGQLRNAATVGGNLLQRTRCAYFQDVTKPCNKRLPGSGCPARAGDHHNLAILGASEACIATNPSDMAVALAALDAVVHVEGLDGPRAIPLTEFHRLPGDEPARDTVLEHGALVTSVDLPPLPLPMATHSRYRKVRERASYAFAIASVAVAIDVSDGTIGDVRIALGAVAPKPWRARVAEAALHGRAPSPELFRAAVDAELAQARPLRDNRYKIPLVRNVVTEMLAELSGVES